ncbi:TPA: hypothetical protein ACPT0V_003375 [Escherichia coli]
MLKHKKIEAVLDEIARQLGHELNGQDRLILRTRVATAMSTKERHRQRMDAKPYQWQKPERPKR